MRKWITLEKSNGVPGTVCYRKHPTRMHDGIPDRYFGIRYTLDKKRSSQCVGWASAGITPKKCFDMLTEIYEGNQTNIFDSCKEENRHQKIGNKVEEEAHKNINLLELKEDTNTTYPDPC